MMTLKTLRFAFITMIFLLFVNCKSAGITQSPGNSATAPGQVKKATGSQSAKPYAPGQQKNNN